MNDATADFLNPAAATSDMECNISQPSTADAMDDWTHGLCCKDGMRACVFSSRRRV